MTLIPNGAFGRRFAAMALLAATALVPGGRAEAQCTVVQNPVQFDPPPDGLPPNGMYPRADEMVLGGTGGARRLLVKYSYGFLVYGLGNPAYPNKLQVKDLKTQEGYPKSGDGLERTNALSVSSDAARSIVAWQDTTSYGTIALATWATGFSGGGDYPPKGTTIRKSTIARVGNRYLAFSMSAAAYGTSVYVADVTTLQQNVPASEASKNSIPSETIAGIDFGYLGSKLVALEAPDGKAYVVVAARDKVTVMDVSNPGAAVPNLSSGFTAKSYSLSKLGISSGQLNYMAAELHPVTSDIHVAVWAVQSPPSVDNPTGLTLTRIPRTLPDTPDVRGSYLDASRTYVPGSPPTIIPFDDDLATIFLERNVVTPGGGASIQLRTAADFSRNLASNLRFTGVEGASPLLGYKDGTKVNLFLGLGVTGAFAASISCAVAPAPAVATLSVDRIPAVGAAQPIADGGVAWLGDTLKIKPVYSPPDTIQPVTDWRLDYDYHAGDADDSSPSAMKLSNADESFVKAGGALPLGEYTLVGPCDPNVAGGTPSTGVGCWASVTANGTYTQTGEPDFATDPVPGSTKDLTIAFEAQNALNAGGSGLATHRIRWTVPTAALKSTSLLAGGTVQVEPQGSPLASGYRWYFSNVPVGQSGDSELGLRASCTGATCNPGLNQPGTYRYWVSVPYKNGFRTPDCPVLNQAGDLCTYDGNQTVKVTDVVLGFTVPPGGIVGAQALVIGSQSVKAGVVVPCATVGEAGFDYDLCQVDGASCPAGSYSGQGLLAPNPFPPSGTGSVTIPMPGEGTWGVRLRYKYTTTGNCAQPSLAYWPSPGAANEWAQVIVTKSKPTIRLRNSSDTADLDYNVLFSSYQITTGVTAKAYAELNGVRDPHPPAGMQWAYVNQSSGQSVTFGSTQGATFSIATAGDYQVVLTGYGIDANVNILAAAPAGGGGGGGGPAPLAISSLQVTNQYPAVGEDVTFTCVASGGTTPYSYQITFGDGAQYAGVTRYTTHAYASSGDYTARCVVTDAVNATALKQQTMYVGSGSGGGGGSCDVRISGATGVLMPYQGEYYVATGQPLSLEAVNTTESASWDFGDGTYGSGSPVAHTWVNATDAEIERTLRLTAGSCTKSYKLFVAPATGPDFTVADAGTGVALEWASDAYRASAGQSLKFTATGTAGAVSWAFGDGTTSTEASPTKAYAPLVDTTYTVRLTNGDKSKQTNVRVSGSTGAALTGNYTFSYSDGSGVSRTAVDPNRAIRFTGVDQATTFTWDFGDGTALGSGSPVLHTFTRGGSFTVMLTVARDGVPGTKQTTTPITFVVKPPPDPLLWVAGGMAYVDNGAGVKWQSDLTVFNPGTQTATISLGFVSGAGSDGATKVTWVPQALVAGETKSYANVLKSLFRLEQGAWGVVLVKGDDIPVAPVIVSRTYNAAGVDTKGTFGLSVPALSVAAGVQPQSAAGGNYLVGLRQDGTFRTNLTVANLKDEAAEVEVVFRGVDGAALGVPARIQVEGRGVKQLDRALSNDVSAGGAGWTTPAPHFSAEVRLTKGSGVYPYATVIDNVTGDAIVATPTPRPSARYRLPGILHYGQWISDVALLNPTANERRVRLEYSYVKKGESDRTAKSKTITLKAFETKVWTDFFPSILELAAGDTSEYSDSFVDIAAASDDAHKDDPFVVNGKTYAASGAGSIGLQVDPYVYEDGIAPQAPSRRILLSGLQANQRFRTNVALFTMVGAGGDDWAEVDVHVVDSFGRELRSVYVRLDADRPVNQLGSSSLFAGLTTTDAEAASIVISNPRGTARVGAYATVIDNLSSDATFVAGQPVP
jgi:PKD repeat protein